MADPPRRPQLAKAIADALTNLMGIGGVNEATMAFVTSDQGMQLTFRAWFSCDACNLVSDTRRKATIDRVRSVIGAFVVTPPSCYILAEDVFATDCLINVAVEAFAKAKNNGLSDEDAGAAVENAVGGPFDDNLLTAAALVEAQKMYKKSMFECYV